MRSIPCALFVCLGLLQGCSQEVVKRSTYETLQNVREQACQKDMTGECEDRQCYDDYQRQRQDLQTKD